MASIDILHPHSLTAAQARQAVEEVAIKLGSKFGLDYRWEGDTLHFVRHGVDGRIALQPQQLHVTATLTGMLAAMKGPIQNKLEDYLNERFAA